jgi:outer membrane protein
MRSFLLVGCLALAAQVAQAQSVPQNQTSQSGELTLDQAIQTAQQNNPQFLQIKNNLRNADAQVRQTHGALLPTLSANAGTRYTTAGTQYQFGVGFPTLASYNSSYSLSLNYNISAGMAFAPKAAAATRRAAEADITSNAELVRATVTQQYITAAEYEAQAQVLDTLVQVAQGQLELAKAKMAAGAGTIIDVRTAEVAVGQAQVNALTAHNNARVAKVQLFQTMGVPADYDTKLTTTFSVVQPTFSLDSLLQLAQRVNPDVHAKQARESAAEANVKLQKTQYLPSLNLQTGYSANAFGYADYNYLPANAAQKAANGFANCMFLDSLRIGAGLPSGGPCGSPVLSADSLARIRSSNQPFQFTRSPYFIQAFIQLPIFNGFQREAGVEQARVQRDNAQMDLRARNLQLRTDVTQAYLNLVTAEKTVELNTQIAAKASEDLALNQESYKVGAKTFLDVTTARGTYEQAQMNRVNAIYDYHKAFAALENAVGRPLR